MGKKTKIVILGAGYGGVHAAKLLNKKYRKSNDVDITLIDKNPYHTLMTELHEVAGGRVEPESVQVDLKKIFNKTKINIVVEQVLKIDINKQVLVTNFGEYAYDYLILGTGSEPAYFGVPGVKENGFPLWSMNDAIKIRHHIEEMFRCATKEKDDVKRKAMLTFAVAGAGFTGIEMIGELVEWKSKLAKEYNIIETDVKLMVIEAMGRILNILDDDSVRKAHSWLGRKGVDIAINAPIIGVEKDSVTLKDGTKILCNTLIWTCGIQGNSFCSDIGLELNNRCRISTNEYMQALGKENIYAVGDCSSLEEGESKNIPQIVEAALQTSDTVANNIIADIESKDKKQFKSNYHGFMVSIGSHYAVANLGGTKLSGFIAMLMKHMVNLHYLFGVGGFYLMIKYLFHEFFNMKDKRSFVGGHLSAKSNTLWLVILRLYIGSMWVIEGVKKIQDGWLQTIKIPMFWPDGVTGASVATNAGTATIVPILSKPPEIMTWFMNILKPIGFQLQIIIVLGEIALGLALIAGLFTFLASVASVGLCIMFILSAMAGWEILWYIAGSIALMGGAGRTFGLDYFIMPLLENLFANAWFGKIKPYYYKN